MMESVNSPERLAKTIDHTNLKPDTTLNDIEKLCMEAKTYGFASVCVNPSNVNFAAESLKSEDIEVCTVIGFPLGANTSRIKSLETKEAVENGATEIDMVMNIGAFKSGFDVKVSKEIDEVISVSNGNKVKVIIETALLTSNEIIKACEIIKETKADFIKTSTGVGYPGAKVEDIELIKKTIGSSPLKIKASGGIRDLKTTLKMINAGATRIGTSSGVQIMKQAELLKLSN
ncbi:MAG: deoxyribose-phosphate aldolase [Methanobacterium sp.]